jgi:hypothetical protein
MPGVGPSRACDNIRFRAAIWGIAGIIKRFECGVIKRQNYEHTA